MSQLMEKILSRENMMLAYKKVKANKGASGIGGISVEEVHEYLKENWASIKEHIQKR
jgi:RNA-directed DNA polymerase